MNRSKIGSEIEQVHTEVQKIIDQFQNRDQHWLSWLIFLYKRFKNLSDGMLMLFDTKNMLCVPIVWRSSLECLIDILLILHDKNYIISLEYQEIESLLVFQNNQRSVKKNLQAINSCKYRLSELKKNSPTFGKKCSFNQKLEALGLTDTGLYDDYRLISRYVHGTPYDHGAADLESISEKCITGLPIMFSDIKKFLVDDEKI